MAKESGQTAISTQSPCSGCCKSQKRTAWSRCQQVPQRTREYCDVSESAEFPWRKSTWSDGTGGGCVSVAHLGNGCAIRDSKDPGPYLLVSLGSWRAFIEGIRRGQFEPVKDGAPPQRPLRSDGA
ncbi:MULTISPECIES: DUF397 domain-containing protein [Nonomuraea]|uniref:DUF397 domain-containing protein n=1 Tax=Nonomuraea roseola TaxID=46179 RepID=A0ABV5PUZ5_9ACTN|nr:DUF397 domain-containing protein [Nonomuraea dietziae]